MSYNRRLNRLVLDSMRTSNQMDKLMHPREHFISSVLHTSLVMNDTPEQSERRLNSALKAFDSLRENII